MHEIKEWIIDAQRNEARAIQEVPTDTARMIVAAAMKKYIGGHPRSWWMELTVPYQRVSSENLPLTTLFQDFNLEAYLIPETEEAELPVYKGNVQAFEELLNACPFFEYYVVAKDESWLVIESDHNEYFLCGSICLGLSIG